MTDAQLRAVARKAAKWELLAGLFGWVWIIGGLAMVVFAGLAVFSDGT